ncbi:MAG: 4Fe-4S binding protein, partial [Betaproteobacteria bacterium]
MKELIVISGKGGTGKTSITASFAMLAEHPVVADCDVDAADLHLVLAPSLRERHVFMSGHQAIIMKEVCCNCGVCLPECRFDAIQPPSPEDGHDTYWIDPTACEGCGVCLEICPMDVIVFPERRCGEWMISDIACGPMVHARLGVAAENSGKLVTTVRQQARRIAEEGNHPIIIVDGA